jgi:hypothetical protein
MLFPWIIYVSNNYYSYSELKCVSCLNACGLYNACMSYVKVVLQFGFRASKPWHRKVVLQFGIRAKVLTLSLHRPVEWSLDRGCEAKLCLEDQFQTLE